MRIRMLRDQAGSPDGVAVLPYVKGVEYDLGASPRSLDLAAAFVREGWAEEVKPEPVIEAKADAETPENKMLEVAPENKGRRRRP